MFHQLLFALFHLKPLEQTESYRALHLPSSSQKQIVRPESQGEFLKDMEQLFTYYSTGFLQKSFLKYPFSQGVIIKLI